MPIGWKSESGAEWSNIEGTTLFIGKHHVLRSIAIADAVTEGTILVDPAEVSSLIAVLQEIADATDIKK